MRRYYFNIRQGNTFESDPHGVELPDVEAVHREAMKAAREILAEYILQGKRIDGQVFEVTDDVGTAIASIPFRSAVRLD